MTPQRILFGSVFLATCAVLGTAGSAAAYDGPAAVTVTATAAGEEDITGSGTAEKTFPRGPRPVSDPGSTGGAVMYAVMSGVLVPTVCLYA